jgi:hypothetical protein
MKKLLKRLVNWFKKLFGAGKSADKDLFPQLKWTCGGINGANAVLTEAKIKNLTVSQKQMAYDWETGGCENLGATSPTDYRCRACLFCHIGNEWVGGFWEYISTSRRTRSLANILGKYKGWNISMVQKADKFAFLIVSASGDRRTNVIVQNGAARHDEFNPNDPEFPPAEFPIDKLD